MKITIQILFVIVVAFSLTSCSTVADPERILLNLPDHAGPDQALRTYMEAYQNAKKEGRDTMPVRREIEKLADRYPYFVLIWEANARLAYNHGELQKARRFLDVVYQMDRNRPEAAVLRSRLAMSDGNLTLARQILQDQIKLAPDHAGLQETLSAVFYFEKKYDQAEEALRLAFKFGGDRTRLNYHRGLIEEARGHTDKAIKHYEEALKGPQSFELAKPRLAALKASQG